MKHVCLLAFSSRFGVLACLLTYTHTYLLTYRGIPISCLFTYSLIKLNYFFYAAYLLTYIFTYTRTYFLTLLSPRLLTYIHTHLSRLLALSLTYFTHLLTCLLTYVHNFLLSNIGCPESLCRLYDKISRSDCTTVAKYHPLFLFLVLFGLQ